MAAIDFRNLTREERSLLVRFACSLAWADARMRPEERAAVARLARSLGLDTKAAREAEAWLERPPAPESTDPAQVPREHRAAFLYALQSVATADIDVAPAERAALERFRRLSA